MSTSIHLRHASTNRTKAPTPDTCVLTVRCVQCADLIDLGPWTAEQIGHLVGLLPYMFSSTICDACVGVVFVGGADD